jgi:hypothetical protein
VFLNLMLHWNGNRWSRVGTPNPAGVHAGDVNELQAIRCTSAANCWGVGTYATLAPGASKEFNWRTADMPSPASGLDAINDLFGVSCTADTNCWAVGASEPGSGGVTRNEALHWAGHKWLLVPVPEPAGTAADSANYLFADRCVSATNCWAVGDTQKFGEPFVNQILHWTGKKWLAAG